MGWLNAVVLVLAVLFPQAVLAQGDGADSTVHITNGQWPPYLGKEEPGYGIVSRIVTRAFEHAGYDVSYEFYPWSRSLYLARKGRRDGTAVWMPSEERREDFHISKPVIVTEYVFFHRKDMAFDWEGVEDLSDYRIGLTRNYDYGDVIDQVESEGIARTERVSSDRLNFEKLLAGRIDLFPMDRVVGQRILNDRFSAEERRQLTWHPYPVRDDHLHLLLSREVSGNKKRIRDFDRALSEMRNDGAIERILVDALGRQFGAVDRLRPDYGD